jgi:hypothetical protein
MSDRAVVHVILMVGFSMLYIKVDLQTKLINLTQLGQKLTDF